MNNSMLCQNCANKNNYCSACGNFISKSNIMKITANILFNFMIFMGLVGLLSITTIFILENFIS